MLMISVCTCESCLKGRLFFAIHFLKLICEFRKTQNLYKFKMLIRKVPLKIYIDKIMVCITTNMLIECMLQTPP